MGVFGGPAITNVVYGGYNVSTNETTDDDYESATSILITIPLNNHMVDNDAAEAWEKEFLTMMKVRCDVYEVMNLFSYQILDNALCHF